MKRRPRVGLGLCEPSIFDPCEVQVASEIQRDVVYTDPSASVKVDQCQFTKSTIFFSRAGVFLQYQLSSYRSRRPTEESPFVFSSSLLFSASYYLSTLSKKGCPPSHPSPISSLNAPRLGTREGWRVHSVDGSAEELSRAMIELPCSSYVLDPRKRLMLCQRIR